MGELVPPKKFQAWQAILNNSKVVERVRELRALTTSVQPLAVSVEDHRQIQHQINEMAQMDLLTNFLLDMHGAEPLVSDSVVGDPKETA